MRIRRGAVLAAATVFTLAVTLIPTLSDLPNVDAAPTAVANAPSVVETDPVAAAGDAADDPAIWVDQANPRRSLVIGNSKKGALETYDLDGHRVQRITSPSGMYGNVDVRGNLVAVAKAGIRVYSVNPASRLLSPAMEGSAPINTSGEGLCLYDPGGAGISGGLYAFVVTRSVGRVRQYELQDTDGDGLVTGRLVRDFTVGTEAEGCVTDDDRGSLFLSEEDVAVWRYGANAADGTARTRVASVGSNLPADAEGLALASGYLLVSAQNVANPGNNYVNVYRATAPYAYVRSVRIVAGPRTDDCDRTDGVAAHAGSLGPAFPYGIFVCQDGSNDAPGTTGHQDFKYVRLELLLPSS